MKKEHIFYKPWQEPEIDAFLRMIERMETEHPRQFRFYFPNQVKAPWHVHCEFEDTNGYKRIISIWPHKAKAYLPDCGFSNGIVVGFENIEEALVTAWAEGDDLDAYDMIDDHCPF